ncbi:MAG: gfo/Idh/MocA family oxidoreductase [Candidatus Dadabacteria bacterium]|nr:MAG: gfo/Idh/MocA family oxidoreductase [Candidatus Dadabacteria bacterium]
MDDGESAMSKAAGDAKLRVGIVGCGTIARTHVPYVRKAGGEIVGVADASPVCANELADRFAIQRVYSSITDLIDVEKPDVVHVLTPPHTHASVAIEALERGVHTLVEKPMTLNSGEARAMKAAAARGRALLCVDHNRLFDPVVLQARGLVERGDLGDLVAVESYQAGSASERPWLETMPGGGLGDLLPHPLYLLLYFLGQVDDIQAMVLCAPGQDQPEELRALLRGGSCSGSLTISSRAHPGVNTLRLCGTRMTVEIDLNNMTLVKRRDFAVPKPLAKSLPSLDAAAALAWQTAKNAIDFVRGKVRYYPGMGELIRRFYAVVKAGGGQPPVTPEEGIAVVEVSERIWRAAEPSVAQVRSGTGRTMVQ